MTILECKQVVIETMDSAGYSRSIQYSCKYQGPPDNQMLVVNINDVTVSILYVLEIMQDLPCKWNINVNPKTFWNYAIPFYDVMIDDSMDIDYTIANGVKIISDVFGQSLLQIGKSLYKLPNTSIRFTSLLIHQLRNTFCTVTVA